MRHTVTPVKRVIPSTRKVLGVLGTLTYDIAYAGLAGWLTDRFYQAGADDVMTLIGNQPIPTSEAAQWTALAVIVGLYIGAALYTPKGHVRVVDARSPKGNPVLGKDRVELAKKREQLMQRIQQVILQTSCQEAALLQVLFLSVSI